MHFTTSPIFTSSEGFVSFFVQENSLIWTSPSIPSSNSIKAPKSVSFVTFPSIMSSTWYFSSKCIHGSSVKCFNERLIRFSGASIRITLSSISCPFFTKSFGRATCPQLISLIWRRPSKPPKSIKAPKLVKLFTVPFTVSPIFTVLKNVSLAWLLCSSK